MALRDPIREAAEAHLRQLENERKRLYDQWDKVQTAAHIAKSRIDSIDGEIIRLRSALELP